MVEKEMTHADIPKLSAVRPCTRHIVALSPTNYGYCVVSVCLRTVSVSLLPNKIEELLNLRRDYDIQSTVNHNRRHKTNSETYSHTVI